MQATKYIEFKETGYIDTRNKQLMDTLTTDPTMEDNLHYAVNDIDRMPFGRMGRMCGIPYHDPERGNLRNIETESMYRSHIQTSLDVEFYGLTKQHT